MWWRPYLEIKSLKVTINRRENHWNISGHHDEWVFLLLVLWDVLLITSASLINNKHCSWKESSDTVMGSSLTWETEVDLGIRGRPGEQRLTYWSKKKELMDMLAYGVYLFLVLWSVLLWLQTPRLCVCVCYRSVVVPVKKPPPGSQAVTTVGSMPSTMATGSTPNIFSAASHTPKSMINTTGTALFCHGPSLFIYCLPFDGNCWNVLSLRVGNDPDSKYPDWWRNSGAHEVFNDTQHKLIVWP